VAILRVPTWALAPMLLLLLAALVPVTLQVSAPMSAM
jgi:hypothetical protein